ncbi:MULTISPECIES: hypothetical protein [Burkholderia]|uniref:hypothetical protein n=1 Tax=Burkholderia TaxID=32008 RepID=UPI000AD31307|nr:MULTISPECIES: hypothetical protein [Burkholderia]MBJ9680340.1 hypothetical protein [Burkholderia multivorans]
MATKNGKWGESASGERTVARPAARRRMRHGIGRRGHAREARIADADNATTIDGLGRSCQK